MKVRNSPTDVTRASAAPHTPHILAIGGLDPSGGAGLVRDFLTARTFGAVVRLIPTAWTEQTSEAGVCAVEPRSARALADDIRAALSQQPSDGSPTGVAATSAIKIGMLPDVGTAAAVLDAIDSFAGAIVFDPVLAASSGGALYKGGLDALVALAGRATLVTPNAIEAAALSESTVRTLEDAQAAAVALRSRGARAVLVKGGHLQPGAGEKRDAGGQGPDVIDVLVTGDHVRHFRGRRSDGRSVRGTGCALATAIAVELAGGRTLEQAIEAAKRWLTAALAHPIAVGDEWHLS